MKKLKRYVLMIPLLAVMLLNCLCYGQVIAADEAIDYSVHHRSADDSPIKDYFDITDVDSVVDYVRNFSQNNSEYYFYSFYLHYNDDIRYSCGEKYSMSLDFSFISDYSGFTEDDNYYIVPSVNYSVRFLFTVDPSTSSFTPFIGNGNPFGDRLIYYKNTGSYDINTTLYYNNPYYNLGHYHYFQYSNIPDFPLFNDYEASQSAMNVNVTFSPELTGAFNRTVTDRGQKVTLDEFSFSVENNSKFDVQYLMAIHKIDDSFYPFPDPINAGYMTVNGKTYTGSPVYVYVKDEWLFLPHGVQGIITAYAPSSWHKVSAGSVDSVTVNFNQLKLNSVDVYDVEVYAVRNDFNYVSPFTNHNTFNYPASADCSIVQEDVQLVYSSRFNIANPAEFDPNNNDNSYAYDEDDRFLFNRANGYIDENGETVIDRVDTNQFVNAGNDPDDPWRGWDDSNDAWEYYYKNQNTVSSDIDQLSNNFSSFFKFVNKTFSYFPKNYQNIIMLGLTSIVVLAVIKVVF